MRRLRACAWSGPSCGIGAVLRRAYASGVAPNMHSNVPKRTTPICRTAHSGTPLRIGNARVYTGRAAGGTGPPSRRTELGPGRLSRCRNAFVLADPRSTRSRAPPPGRTRRGRDDGLATAAPPLAVAAAGARRARARRRRSSSTWSRGRRLPLPASTSSTPASSSTATSCGSAGTPAGTVDAIRLTPNGQAEIEVSIDSSFGPLRQGTTAADPPAEPGRRRQPLHRRQPGADVRTRAARQRGRAPPRTRAGSSTSTSCSTRSTPTRCRGCGA